MKRYEFLKTESAIIFLLFLSFDIVGECPLATEARRLASLRRGPSYQQHITMGLRKRSDFPEVVVERKQESWRDKIWIAWVMHLW